MSSENILETTTELALDILEEARSSLMTTLRFLDVALFNMPHTRANLNASLATDGRHLFFDPYRVVMRYRESADELLRDYLHTIMHCVYQSPFDARHPDARTWDLACDIAVEATVFELCGLRYPSGLDTERKHALKTAADLAGKLTAPRLYRALLAAGDGPEERHRSFEHWESLFARDDHEPWPRGRKDHGYLMRVDEDKTTLIESDGTEKIKGDGEDADLEEEKNKSTGVDMPGMAAEASSSTAVEAQVENPDTLVNTDAPDDFTYWEEGMEGLELGDYSAIAWQDISKQIQMDMETFNGKFGVDAGTFLINLTVTNRKQYDFKDFLRRFASRSEELKVSPDEFDYIYYTYGLKKYKNMPLIEPLEYQESNRVRDFVIAVDTSASCAGGLIKRFIERTYDVLKSSEGFGRKINVHVIQCDCEIRKETKITSVREIDDSFMEFSVRGFGGTDFRPVFARVDELIKAREFSDLKGLIYLTDGHGKYPDKPPGYDTVFVFLDETQGALKVPPWAMKVVMDEDQIIEM